MNNNRKTYFPIDSGTLTDEIFTLLDTVQSDNEDEIDELMNNFDTDFIAPNEIKLTGNPDNANVLTPEANVHLVDEGVTHTKELETNKTGKIRKKILQSHAHATFLYILKRVAFLRAGCSTNLTKVL